MKNPSTGKGKTFRSLEAWKREFLPNRIEREKFEREETGSHEGLDIATGMLRKVEKSIA